MDVAELSFEEMDAAFLDAETIQEPKLGLVKTKTSIIAVTYEDYKIVPTKWILGGIVPSGHLLYLAGFEKLGKSWLTFDAAICISTGQTLLETWKPRETGRVIFYSPEGATNARVKRLRALCAGRDINYKDAVKNLIFMETPVNVMDKKCMADLGQFTRETGARLLILDPWVSCIGEADENDNAQMQMCLMQLRKMIIEIPDLSIMVVAHYAKSQKDKYKAHSIRGASAQSAAADGMIFLEEYNSDEIKNARCLKFSYRDIENPAPLQYHAEITVGQDREIKTASLAYDGRGSGVGRPRDEKLPGKIIEALVGQEKGLTANEVASKTGATYKTALRYLRSMVSDSTVERRYDGKFELVPGNEC